jgi:TRAP-type C4-dicarboxylate transport system permease small subunit
MIMLKKIVKISSKLLLLERFMIVFFTISMIGLYGLNVFVREITPQYASSFAWIDEASRLLMVWVVFLSIGLAFDKGRHIAMTTFINQLKNIYFVYIGKIIDFSGFIFSSYCIWLAFNITVFVFNTGQISPTLNMPMYILYVAPTIGFTLLSIRYFLSLINFNNRFNISKHR